ncbi:MAG: peptidoglycan DD-metalloendopeptidase family protein [Trueperaceae bacterium]|nr:peptidoglycan DD-metalloendopeptidase family protein [Trueperaceae bacterium]
MLGSPWNLAAAWTFDSATPSGTDLPPAFARPVTFHTPADDGVTYEGVGAHLPAQKVPASQARDAATDAAFLLPPFHRSTYTLPFQPGQAWEIWFGNETLNSHFGYAAFTWDVRLATSSGDSHLESAEPSSCDQPLLAIASGAVTSVDDDNYDPTEKDRANAVRFQAAPEEHVSYLHIRDGSSSDEGLAAGDPVASGQLVAKVGTRQTDNCHLHFGVRSETVTIPVAFRDYETSDDQGQTWYHVDRGVPGHGQWVRNLGDNAAPTIQIVAPADGADFWYGGLGEPFEAVVSDPEDGGACCGVRWTSDIDGFLGTGTQTNLALSPGTHLITAQAQDTQGATASDSITVTAENVAPTVTVVAPEANATLYRDTPYVLGADVNDVNEPLADLCSATEWSSSASDPVLQGCAPQATFTSNGPRTLTVTVSDEHGLTGTATVDVQVVDPPPTGPPQRDHPPTQRRRRPRRRNEPRAGGHRDRSRRRHAAVVRLVRHHLRRQRPRHRHRRHPRLDALRPRAVHLRRHAGRPAPGGHRPERRGRAGRNRRVRRLPALLTPRQSVPRRSGHERSADSSNVPRRNRSHDPT